MNKKLIAGIVGGVILCIGIVVAVLLLTKHGSNSGTTTNKTADAPKANAVDPSKEFKPVSPKGVPFVMTQKSGETTTVTQSDKEGNSKVVMTPATAWAALYVVDGKSYECKKEASECKESGVVPQTSQNLQQLSDQDFLKSFTYSGRQDCPAGSCYAWTYQKDSIKYTYLLDKESRLSQITVEVSYGKMTNKSVATYEYKDVAKITAPKL